MQRSQRNSTYCPYLNGLLSLVSNRTQDHQLMIAQPKLALNHQSLIVNIWRIISIKNSTSPISLACFKLSMLAITFYVQVRLQKLIIQVIQDTVWSVTLFFTYRLNLNHLSTVQDSSLSTQSYMTSSLNVISFASRASRDAFRKEM